MVLEAQQSTLSHSLPSKLLPGLCNLLPFSHNILSPFERSPCCPWIHSLRLKKLYAIVVVPPAPVQVPDQSPLAPIPAVHGAMGCGHKSFKLVWRCHQLVLFRGRRPLAPSVMSVTNDKGDNEMIPGAVHRSPAIYLRAEENPRKPQLGEINLPHLYSYLN